MLTGIINPASRRAGFATLLAAFAVTGLAFSAAATAGEAPTIRVRISDLNLASPQGQRVLEQRVFTAVRTVCAPKTASVSASAISNVSRVRVAQCRRDTLAHVQRQLDQHGLPKLYVARGN